MGHGVGISPRRTAAGTGWGEEGRGLWRVPIPRMLLQCSQPGPASFRARKGEDGDAGAQPCCHQGGTPTRPRWYLAVLEEPDDVLEAVVAEKDGLEDRPVLTAQHGWDGIYNEVEIAQHPSHARGPQSPSPTTYPA